MPDGYLGPIVRGEVWWADKVRSPDNQWESKDRRVLIVWPGTPVTNTSGESLLMAVGISTSPSDDKHRNGHTVRLPDKQTYPETESGLDLPCWAVASWCVLLTPCYLDKRAGKVRDDMLLRVLEIIRETGPKPIRMKCEADGPVSCDYCRSAR